MGATAQIEKLKSERRGSRLQRSNLANRTEILLNHIYESGMYDRLTTRQKNAFKEVANPVCRLIGMDEDWDG